MTRHLLLLAALFSAVRAAAACECKITAPYVLYNSCDECRLCKVQWEFFDKHVEFQDVPVQRHSSAQVQARPGYKSAQVVDFNQRCP